MALIYAIAWWTTWKEKPSERVWGIAAGLLHLSAVLFVMHFARVSMNEVVWGALSFGALALVAYSWPGREDDPKTREPLEGDDLIP